MSCPCRCHTVGLGAYASCDVGAVQPGGNQSCSPCDAIEDACVLPHPEPAQRWHGRLCRRHYHQILDRLRELETLAALGDDVIVPGPSSDGRHPTMSGSPAPGRVEWMMITDARMTVLDEWPDVAGVLAEWARAVVDDAALVGVDGLPLAVGGAVSGNVRLLRREHRWIAGQPWVDDYAGELAHLHRALAAATGAGMWRPSIGRCPHCRARLHLDPAGADVVACWRCGSAWSGVHYLRLRLIVGEDLDPTP